MVLDLKNYSNIKLMGNPQCNFKRVISAIEGSMVFAHEDMPKENRFEEEAKKRAMENAMRRAGRLKSANAIYYGHAFSSFVKQI